MAEIRTLEHREVLITLTQRQYEEMGEQLEQIKADLGTDSNTAAITEAVRRHADTLSSDNEQRSAA